MRLITANTPINHWLQRRRSIYLNATHYILCRFIFCAPFGNRMLATPQQNVHVWILRFVFTIPAWQRVRERHFSQREVCDSQHQRESVNCERKYILYVAWSSPSLFPRVWHAGIIKDLRLSDQISVGFTQLTGRDI
jgi:hypothetical protein